MSVAIWILIALVAIAIIGALVWLFVSRSRTAGLKQQFGPEYEREVGRAGSRQAGESDLAARRSRVEQLDIRPLDPAARQRYAARWRDLQTRFVDEPHVVLGEADELVILVMGERGYPTEDFERRAEDVSVDHPQVVENYRTAHEISTAAGSGEATTEDLRQGLVSYRALFVELLGEDDQAT